jgi:sugar phosphate isomerase/epimerase
MNSKNTGLRLGTTLYSLTTQFHGREYTFDDLVRKVAAENLGPGLEVVGFQSIRGFPEVSDAFADHFRGLIEETGLEPSCLGINADFRISRDRDLSVSELVAYHERQLHAAAKLGFPVVRYQYPAGPEVIERLVPLAEKLGVKLGLELHAPHHVQHPDVLAFREMYARVGSPYLGFIPDFGASARAVPPSFIVYFRELGIPESLIQLALEHWNGEGEAYPRRDKFQAEARALGANERFITEISIIFGLFSRQNPEAWLEIMPQVVHIHGKFFDFADDGTEVSVDYDRILPIFVNAGYNGFMSSEYEGHMWTDSDGFDKLRRHHALARRVLGSLKEVEQET